MRRAVLLLCSPLLLAACTSSPERPQSVQLPPSSAFVAGTCRDAAPPLTELAQLLPGLGEDGVLEAAQQETLRDVQDRLFALSATVEPEHAQALDEVVEGIGGVRIRAAGNSYEPVLGEQLQTSLEELVAGCTT